MVRFVKMLVAASALIGVGLVSPAMAQSASEVAVRMQQLEEQVRRLTGQVEELSFEVKQLRAQGSSAGAVPQQSGAAGQLTPPAAQIAGQLESLRGQALAQATAPRGGGYGRQPAPKVASLDASKRISPQVKHQLAQLVGMVRQLAPGSKYASRAEEITLELGLELPAGP